MAPESPDMRVLEILLPRDLANWLDAKVSDMTFASQSHGVARALHIVRSMPDMERDTWPSR